MEVILKESRQPRRDAMRRRFSIRADATFDPTAPSSGERNQPGSGAAQVCQRYPMLEERLSVGIALCQ
ncbi:MAG: hypothetical protein BWY63_00853 [Chloroflexi bacterium ADurb.Bin360]|nr:MAG: hypothetical protein BWY63_00853 [Chloroflexi bacterium ADurb.Bin360]